MPVANTGFETNVAGWTGVSATLAQDATQHDVGSFSMKVTSTGSPSEAYAMSDVMTCNPGSVYTVGASLFSSAASRHALIRLRFFDAGMGFIQWTTAKGLTLPTGSWSHNPNTSTTPITAPANAVFVAVEIVMDASPATGSVIFVDQITYSGPELAINIVYEAAGTGVPGYQVTVSGLSTVPNVGFVTAVRQTQSGHQSEVRGLSDLAVVADTATATDFEYSYQAVAAASGGADQNWIYFAKAFDTSNHLVAQVGYPQKDALQSRTDILSTQPLCSANYQSIQQPALSVPIIMSDFAAWDVPGRVLSTNYVLQRANPVVLTDASGGRTGSFVVAYIPEQLTYSLGELKTLLYFNDTFMLQAYYQASGVDDMYFKVTGISVSRPGPAYPNDNEPDGMLFTVSFIEVDRPLTSGDGTNIVTWQNVLNNPAITTWTDVSTHWPDWLGVLNNPDL